MNSLTIIPRARTGYESIADEAEGRMGYWRRGYDLLTMISKPSRATVRVTKKNLNWLNWLIKIVHIAIFHEEVTKEL